MSYYKIGGGYLHFVPLNCFFLPATNLYFLLGFFMDQTEFLVARFIFIIQFNVMIMITIWDSIGLVDYFLYSHFEGHGLDAKWEQEVRTILSSFLQMKPYNWFRKYCCSSENYIGL